MTDWIMIIITAVYVVATIVICVFNGKTAKAAKEQIETEKQQIAEMIRQYNETNRPIVVIRFEIIRSGLLCFVLENIGSMAASNVKVSINDEFINGIEKQDKRIRLREITNSSLFLSAHQKIYIFLGGQSHFSKIAENKAIINITYNEKYDEHTEIDLWQYRYLLMYSSELEDISQHLKKIGDEEKNYHRKLLNEISDKGPVSVLVHSKDFSKKSEVFKTVCMNPGSNAEEIAKMVGVSNEMALNILLELELVDRLVHSFSNFEDDMKDVWYRL